MRDYLAWSASSTITSLTAFVVGLRWGAVGVAAAFALSDLFVCMPAPCWWATRRGPIRLGDLYLSAAPFAAGAATAFFVFSLVQHLTFANNFVLLATSAVIAYAASWSTVSRFARGPRHDRRCRAAYPHRTSPASAPNWDYPDVGGLSTNRRPYDERLQSRRANVTRARSFRL